VIRTTTFEIARERTRKQERLGSMKTLAQAHIADARAKRNESQGNGDRGTTSNTGRSSSNASHGRHTHYGPSSTDAPNEGHEGTPAERALGHVSTELQSTRGSRHAELSPRNMIYHAISLKNTTEEQNRPMSIAVRKELPTINLVLGKDDDHATLTVKLSVLFDTCGAIST
jgi:hypothetical protein